MWTVLAQSLPDGSKMLNLCDRGYPFLTGFCAALVSGKTNVLPPSRAPEILQSVAGQFADIFCLTGGENFDLDMPTIVFLEMIKRLVPMKRAGRVAEAADVVAFLASEKASYISGQIIGVDGGIS